MAPARHHPPPLLLLLQHHPAPPRRRYRLGSPRRPCSSASLPQARLAVPPLLVRAAAVGWARRTVPMPPPRYCGGVRLTTWTAAPPRGAPAHVVSRSHTRRQRISCVRVAARASCAHRRLPLAQQPDPHEHAVELQPTWPVGAARACGGSPASMPAGAACTRDGGHPHAVEHPPAWPAEDAPNAADLRLSTTFVAMREREKREEVE